MIKKKLKLYYRGLVQHLFKKIYGEISVPKKIDNLIKIEKINDLYLKLNNKNYHIYKVKNARIYTDNNENVAIIKDNFILPFISFQQVKGKLKNVKHNTVLKIGTPSFVKKFKGSVFNLCQGGSGNNYFHFIFDIIPKIYLLKSKMKIQKINYFYLTDPKKWQIKILKLLGINEKKIISSKTNNHIEVDEIFAVDHPWYNKGFVQHNVGKIPKWIINQNRKIFLKNIYKKHTRNIFIDRSHSKYNHCQIENINDIINTVSKKKFQIHKPEYLNFKEQIKLFNTSSTIIGAHGAAFTNIIFCKPKTKIIEIIPADHPNKKCQRISKILKLRYFRIKTKPNNSDPNYPFRINLAKKNLREIMKIIDL